MCTLMRRFSFSALESMVNVSPITNGVAFSSALARESQIKSAAKKKGPEILHDLVMPIVSLTPLGTGCELVWRLPRAHHFAAGASRTAPKDLRPSRPLPTTGRGLEPSFEERKVFIRALEDFSAGAHVRTSEFIGRAIQVAQLKLTLAQSQVEEWIFDGIGAVHRHGQIIPTSHVVPTKEVRVSDSAQNPSGSFPICLWLRQEIPRSPILLERGGIICFLRELIAFSAEGLNSLVDCVVEFSHRAPSAAEH